MMDSPLPTPASRRPGWLIPVLVAGVVLVLAGVATWALLRSPANSASTAAGAPTKATPLHTEAADPPVVAAPYKPTKLDFQLKLKITRKKCFGSAGCNIDYHIDLTYVGATLDDSQTWVVTYEVTGVEDGPAINTFEITGDQYSYDESESAQTADSSTKLKVKVTDVEEK